MEKMKGFVQQESQTGSGWPSVQTLPTTTTDDDMLAFECEFFNMGQLINKETGDTLGVVYLRQNDQSSFGLFSYFSGDELRQLATAATTLADVLDTAASQKETVQ